MRSIRILSLCVIFGASPALLRAKESSAEKLLNSAIRNPGTFSQMCDIQFVPKKAPIPLYGLLIDSEFQFRTETLAKLRASRPDVISVLVKKLEGIDLSVPPVEGEMKLGSNFDSLESTGLDPNHLSQLLLNVVIDLNAVECLPELLRLEQDLSRRLEANFTEPAANPVPEFQLEGGFVIGSSESLSKESEARGDRDLTEKEEAEREVAYQRATAIVVQRDLLATMLVLLRQEKFPPLLSSAIEKKYADVLKREAAEENFAMIKSGADISASDAESIAIDPIVGVPFYAGRKSTEIQYSPKVRQQIIDWARSYLSTPVEKRLGASGMSPRPYVR
ncbi:MAG: hypothetical protein KBF76_16015 [Verrucomicrobiales bacterium]|nr:hypothetical protein [Verrucomicrobiales bacterium]